MRLSVVRFLTLSLAVVALPSMAEAGARRRVRIVGAAPAAGVSAPAAVKSDEEIQQVIRSTPTGGVAQLPFGAFRTAVVIDRSMTLVGSPAGTTFDGSTLGLPGIEILAGVTDVTIEGVRIFGATDGIAARGGNDRLLLRRVAIAGASNMGARIATSADVALTDVTFDGNVGGGLDLTATRARLTGLSFHANGGSSARLAGQDIELIDGAFDTAPEGVRFAGLRCRVFRATMRDVAIVARFAAGSDTSTLSRTDVRGCSSLAIADEGSIFATIEGNRTDVTASDAIRLAGSWHAVEGNTIAGSKGAGVTGRGTSLRVADNTFQAPGAEGVRLEGDGNTVEANHIVAAGLGAVRVIGSGCVIAMNDCPQASGAGVDAKGSHNVIVGNHADNARLEGLRVEGDANVLQGNQLVGTGAAGIRIVAGAGNLVTANSILRCGGRGFEDAGTGTTLEANRID